MIAGEKHLRNGQAVPDFGARVLRVLEQSVPVALVREADLVAQNARDKAAYRVRDHHRRKLAAG